MPGANTVLIVAVSLVVIALATVGLLRRDLGQPVTDAQVSSSTVGAYYRADLEALYLHEVRSREGAAPTSTDAELLARGHGICSALDAGAPAPEGAAASEVDVAVAALCPQHAGITSS